MGIWYSFAITHLINGPSMPPLIFHYLIKFLHIYTSMCVCERVFQISISRRIGSLTIMVKAVF